MNRVGQTEPTRGAATAQDVAATWNFLRADRASRHAIYLAAKWSGVGRRRTVKMEKPRIPAAWQTTNTYADDVDLVCPSAHIRCQRGTCWQPSVADAAHWHGVTVCQRGHNQARHQGRRDDGRGGDLHRGNASIGGNSNLFSTRG